MSAIPAFDKAQLADYSKLDKIPQYFLALLALHHYRDFHHKMPAPGSERDAGELVGLAKKLNDDLKQKAESVDDKFIARLSRQVRHSWPIILTPL